MDLFEYEARNLLAAHGVPVPSAALADRPEEVRVAADLFGGPVVVKAQVKTGGRGKAGGVRLAGTPAEAAAHAEAMLGVMAINGHRVRRVLVVPASEIAEEYYLSFLVDRASRAFTAIACAEGGVEIERLAADRPEAVARVQIDPARGFTETAARELAAAARFPADVTDAVVAVMLRLWEAFTARDALLVEINPLAREAGGRIVALDAKVTLDDNAQFRHPDHLGLSGHREPTSHREPAGHREPISHREPTSHHHSGHRSAGRYGTGPHDTGHHDSRPHGAGHYSADPHDADDHGTGHYGSRHHGTGPRDTGDHGTGPHGAGRYGPPRHHGTGPYSAGRHEADHYAADHHDASPYSADDHDEDPFEREARGLRLNYVRLDGQVGVIGNGAGLVMSTLDAVADAGTRHGGIGPANFLDIGGGASAGTMADGLGVILSDPRVRSVLVNVFGGITACDAVADGIVRAFALLEERGEPTGRPIVVRLDGNSAERGRRILYDAALPGVLLADTMDGAAAEAARLAAVAARAEAAAGAEAGA